MRPFPAIVEIVVEIPRGSDAGYARQVLLADRERYRAEIAAKAVHE